MNNHRIEEINADIILNGKTVSKAEISTIYHRRLGYFIGKFTYLGEELMSRDTEGKDNDIFSYFDPGSKQVEHAVDVLVRMISKQISNNEVIQIKVTKEKFLAYPTPVIREELWIKNPQSFYHDKKCHVDGLVYIEKDNVNEKILIKTEPDGDWTEKPFSSKIESFVYDLFSDV